MNTQPAWRAAVGRAIAFARRRPRVAAGAVALLAVAGYCSSWVPELRGVVRDSGSSPVAGAWIVYDYMGRVPYPSPCGTRHVPVDRVGGIVRTDAEGRFTIPARLHLFCPSMELQIHGVFAETVHSAVDRDGHAIRAHFWPRAVKVPGNYAHADFADADFEIELSDCAGSPRRWLDSLDALERAALGSLDARERAATGGYGSAVLGGAERRAIAQTLIREYGAFLGVHAAVVPEGMDRYGRWSYARGRNSYEAHVQQRLEALQQFVL